jgi:hypothetical protein
MTKEVDKPNGSTLPKDTKRKPPGVVLEWSETGTLEIHPNGEYDRITGAMGSSLLTAGLLMQVAVLGGSGKKACSDAAGFALGFVDAMKPKDAAEALLLAQMATVHQATMMLASRFSQAGTTGAQDMAEKALNKTARTYAAQMDALKRYRSKGQQTVRVERVTVEEGGQAIVGNVETGGRGDDGK